MKSYITYDVETGEILSLGSTPWPEAHPLKNGEAMIVGKTADPKTQRVSKDGRLIRKRSLDVEDREVVEAWRSLRNQRATRLAQTDWTQMPDSPVDATAWQAYRQALRDLPANTTDPRNVEWPEAPE